MGTLSGKTIIVTGAAGAIGHATALVLAREGANLLLVDINAAQLAEREQAVAGAGARVRSIRADVSRGADVKAYVQAALDAFGRIDGLFSNAGIEEAISRPPGNTTKRNSTASTRVNVNGVFLGMR